MEIKKIKLIVGAIAVILMMTPVWALGTPLVIWLAVYDEKEMNR